ncbi:SCO family protein, partial [Pseudoxanthomonas sp. SGD-10]
GEVVNIDSIKNQLLVINLFYTGNDKMVSSMYPNLQRLYNRYKENKRLRFLSITVNPEEDTQEAITEFAAKYNAPAGKWDFLRADTSQVFAFASKQLFIDAFESDGLFVHSDKVVLIDEERRIRGYYAATSSQEMKKLGEEIKVLIAEELRKIKLD